MKENNRWAANREKKWHCENDDTPNKERGFSNRLFQFFEN